MSGERSLACLRSWVLVWEQGAFPSSQAGPGPGPNAWRANGAIEEEDVRHKGPRGFNREFNRQFNRQYAIAMPKTHILKTD